MINSIRDKFNSFEQKERYSRVENHSLNLFLGKDKLDRCTLLMISSEKPKKITSSKFIFIEIGQRKDKKWAVMFILVNDKYLDVFLNFCSDLINSSRNCKNNGMQFICERYVMWQQMLKEYNQGLLSFEEQKGLIGELYFLKESLIELMGIESAINSWVGPLGADQDFRYLDKWYEIKTTSPGKPTIKISSVEQLDTSEIGKLVVLYLDITSEADNNKISLNYLVDEVRSLASQVGLINKIDYLLIKKGYIKRDEYNENLFKFIEKDIFVVSQEFPCIRKCDLPSSVTKVSYDLIVASLEQYKEIES